MPTNRAEKMGYLLPIKGFLYSEAREESLVQKRRKYAQNKVWGVPWKTGSTRETHRNKTPTGFSGHGVKKNHTL